MYKKFGNKIRLDLFKLHDAKDDITRWIHAQGKNLKPKLKALIDKTDFSSTQLVKYLMKKFNISIATAERLVYLKKEWYPLIFIKELTDLTNSSKRKIQDKIEFLKSSRPPVVEYKAVKELTINLCKIAGAYAADGTLRDKYLAITDYYKSNILALIKWFEDFNYKPKLNKISENEYGIKFHSKIITRYLTKFFDFPSGCKQYSVKEPEIIKRSPLRFRKAFCSGALTFEAGLATKSEVSFCVASRPFRDSIVYILNKLEIPCISMTRPSGKYWRFWSNGLTREEASKWIELFEPYTEKWFKLRDYIYGFSKKVGSFQEALSILNKIYPKQNSTKATVGDAISTIKELRQTHRYELATRLRYKNNLTSFGGKWAHSLRHPLEILKRTNMISVQKKKFGPKKSFGYIVREVYIFNENIPEWRLPER